MMMSYSNNTFFPTVDANDVETSKKNSADVGGLSKEAGVTAPSIYLRPEAGANANEPPALQAQNNELDVLWSSSQNRTSLLREETNPALVLGVGFLTGVILTTLAFWLIFSPASNPFQANPNQPTPKVVNQQQAVEPDTVATNPTATGNTAPAVTPADPNAPIAKGTIYKVKSGDNLGSIALSVYGDSSPAMLDRILKANKLANANKLSLNQELIIPPKNY
jgi:nucleoid-associated protein YgaU